MKYEVDKQSGALFVDRFMTTAMHYPANYGYVPQTVADDDDPVDVLVHTPFPIDCRGWCCVAARVGVLRMDDESGGDAKLLAVPDGRYLPAVRALEIDFADVPDMRLQADSAFFRALQGPRSGQMGQDRRLGRRRRGAHGDPRTASSATQQPNKALCPPPSLGRDARPNVIIAL
jgi:inorganic pyrophosphatase